MHFWKNENLISQNSPGNPETVQNHTQYNRWQIWMLAARPKTLWASIVPVAVAGSLAYADRVFHTPAFCAAMACAILIQVGTNLANDLFDFQKGADSIERTGPLRVTQAGLVSLSTMKKAIVLTNTLALLIGAYLIWRGGMPIAIIGLTSLALGLLYTWGPSPLGYNGLADIFVLVFFGPVAVGGSYYVMALNIHDTVIFAGIPLGMLSTAILTVNNLRDIESDAACGKRTLAVRFGRRFAQIEYMAMIIGAMVFPILIATSISPAHFSVIFTSLTILPAISLMKAVFREPDGTALNTLLARTGKLLALYGLIFSVGWNV